MICATLAFLVSGVVVGFGLWQMIGLVSLPFARSEHHNTTRHVFRQTQQADVVSNSVGDLFHCGYPFILLCISTAIVEYQRRNLKTTVFGFLFHR